MANGVWIPCYDSIREHKKTYALADTLGIPVYSAVGIVISLSTWASVNAENGNIGEHPPAAIARAIGWEKKKDPQKLIDALVKTGWLDKREKALYIHDHEDYSGRLMELRQMNKERVKAYRDRNKRITCNGDNAITQSLLSRATQHNTIVTEDIRSRETDRRITLGAHDETIVESVDSVDNSEPLTRAEITRQLLAREIGNAEYQRLWKEIEEREKNEVDVP